jgi:Domain of unknown function (DUF3127)
MEITGQIHKIGDVINVSDKFSKREVIITIPDDKYPQHISLQLTGKNINLSDTLAVGSQVKASINLRGRLYTGADGVEKCFNSLEAWKFDVIGTAPVQYATMPSSQSNDDIQELPF